MNISKELFYALKRERITQTQISEDTGITQATISRALKDPMRANVRTLALIAKAVGCELTVKAVK